MKKMMMIDLPARTTGASPSSEGLGERLALGVGDGGDAPFGESSLFVRLISPCRGREGGTLLFQPEAGHDF